MISIIIPTLNEESVIEKTLQNLRTIKSVPYEIIVADTKSKDRTREIAEQYADTVVVYSGEKRPNAGIIRNLGASVAKGDLFLFQDADVLLQDADHFVMRVVETFEKDPKLVGLTAATRVTTEFETLTDRVMYWIINRTFVILNLLRIGGSGGECQVVRRDAFEKVGGYTESLPIAEDNELFQKLTKIGRTRIRLDLLTRHPGRRSRALGWPRLLWQWQTSWITMTFLHKSAADTWEEIR